MPKKKTVTPQAPAGPRTRNAPIDITNWRQQSQNRAHERNRITWHAAERRGREVAERLGAAWVDSEPAGEVRQLRQA